MITLILKKGSEQMVLSVTATEKRVLQSLHLQGHMGKMGSMKLAERRSLLLNLITKGLIDQNGKLTELGVYVSAPKFD
jgi:hypothetical protein